MPKLEKDHIVKRGSKWLLLSKKTGKVLGRHATREEAVKQEQAIEAAKHARDTGTGMPPPSESVGAEAGIEHDGWFNALSGLGDPNKDRREAAQWTVDLIDYPSLGTFYRGSDLAARVIDLPAEDMTREGGDVRIESDEELAEEMGEELERLGADAAFLQALKWKRAYGGSVIFMGINDGQNDLSQPVNEQNIKSIDALNVFDAFEARPVATDWQDNPVLADFGTPTHYQLNPHVFAAGLVPLQRVHKSRFLVFQGPLSNRRQLRNSAAGLTQGWGDSVLVRLAKHIRDYDQAWGGVSHLLTDVAQAVFKMDQLANALLADKDKAIMKRLQMINLARSTVNAALIDKDKEEFERKGTPLAGVAEILRESMDRVAAAAGIPTVVLFGISPGGMNATGENDVQVWYDAVAAKQRKELKPQVKQLLRYAFLAKEGPAGGKMPEQWNWKFRSLWQETDTEKADIRLKNAQTDKIYHDLGVASTEDIGTSRWGGDEYSMDLTIDLDALEERMAQDQERSDVEHEAAIESANTMPSQSALNPPAIGRDPVGKESQMSGATYATKPPAGTNRGPPQKDWDEQVGPDPIPSPGPANAERTGIPYRGIFKLHNRVMVKATKETGSIVALVDKVAVLMDVGANTLKETIRWFDADELTLANDRVLG